ncbi:MAG: pyrroline-5-carboxylate reductase [Bacteroidales bacterium]|nr:pyrroline-5-carboxylate reductase [Bacteroidales bacterium]
MNTKIAIIGGGNLGTAIAKGLVKNNFYPNNIIVTRRKVGLLNELKKLGINTSADNKEAVKNSEVILLCVKPYKIDDILKEIAPYIHEKHLMVSMVSGVSIEHIKSIVKHNIPVYRAMPNTAIAINESMTCIAVPNAGNGQKELMKSIFSGLGDTVFMNEEMMDAATVLAACGIAFVMRFIRAMVQGGIEIGFDAKTASQIANQTVKGAAELLIQNGLHPEQEIDKVTTPKGYTISGLNEMEHNGFSSSLIKGILTSFNKINA